MAGITVVKVQGPFNYGSGVFVTDRLVVTAGHVIQHVPGPLDPDDYEIQIPGGGVLAVASLRSMPRWAQMFHPDSDMGIVRVTTSRPNLVVPYELDPVAAARAVVVVGYPATQYAGTVTRVAGSSGYDQLSSDDLAFPSGTSGGPVLDGDTAIGIATRSPPTSGADVLIALPFLDDSLAWLIANCP